MNLVQYIVAGGEGSGPTAPCPQCGPGSGCHGDCGRPSSAVSEMLDTFKSKLRPEIIEKMGYVVKEDPKLRNVGIGQAGAIYRTKDKSINIPPINSVNAGQVVALKRKVAHELGHYLEHEFLAMLDTTKLSGSDKLNVQAMLDEYGKEKARWKGNEARSNDDSENLLRGYALRSQHEWFAEATKYFLLNDSYHSSLQKDAPATFKLLQSKFGRK